MARKLLLTLAILTVAILILGSLIFKKNLNKQTKLPITFPTILPRAQEKAVVAENLEVPWALVFLPDKSMLLTERKGRVRFIDKDGNLNPNPILQIPDVKANGEGGLLGIAIHPNFKANQFVYLYYTYSGNELKTLNRVARFKFENNTLLEKTIIVDAIPGAPNHNGGRIKFGPDKFLYITTGDAQNPSLAQDKNSLAGKILRLSDDGKVPKDNPFDNPVYSYGHRNAQGLAWGPNGTLWATEHGRSGVLSGLDELNLIEIGKNYGWPVIQGDETRKNMVTPKINSGPFTTWAPAGAAYINGSVFFGGLKGQTLYEAVIKNDEVATIKEHFKKEFGRIRDVVVGPDNLLYITTSNRDGRGTPKPNDDKIIRVNPQKL